MSNKETGLRPGFATQACCGEHEHQRPVADAGRSPAATGSGDGADLLEGRQVGIERQDVGSSTFRQ
jgi:hypothetical protein